MMKLKTAYIAILLINSLMCGDAKSTSERHLIIMKKPFGKSIVDVSGLDFEGVASLSGKDCDGHKDLIIWVIRNFYGEEPKIYEMNIQYHDGDHIINASLCLPRYNKDGDLHYGEYEGGLQEFYLYDKEKNQYDKDISVALSFQNKQAIKCSDEYLYQTLWEQYIPYIIDASKNKIFYNLCEYFFNRVKANCHPELPQIDKYLILAACEEIGTALSIFKILSKECFDSVNKNGNFELIFTHEKEFPQDKKDDYRHIFAKSQKIYQKYCVQYDAICSKFKTKPSELSFENNLFIIVLCIHSKILPYLLQV